MVADGGTDPARREARPPNGAIECNITPDGEELSDLPAAALLTHWEVVEVELIQPSATFETTGVDAPGDVLSGKVVIVRVLRWLNRAGIRTDSETLHVRLWEQIVRQGGIRETLDEGPGVAALSTLRAGDRALALLSRDAAFPAGRRLVRVWALDRTRGLMTQAMRQAAGTCVDVLLGELDRQRVECTRRDRADGGVR